MQELYFLKNIMYYCSQFIKQYSTYRNELYLHQKSLLPMFMILIVVVAVVAFVVMRVYNKIVQNKNLVEDAWSNIDVALKRRHDLIPNLVNTVKGYATHEQETLNQVIEARNAAVSAKGDIN